MKMRLILSAGAAALLVACTAPQQGAAPATENVAEAPVTLEVPSGAYKLDPNHASLRFSVVHLGLAPYNARFAKIDADLTIDAANPSASKLKFTVDPASVKTDYAGNYAQTHKGSPFKSFEEAIAKGLLGAEKTPEVVFQSTTFTMDGGSKGTLTGDLTLNGVTKPATFAVTLVGQMPKHPFTQTPAIGFSAIGTIKRSDFAVGEERLNAALSDEVTLTFDGEFSGVPAEAPAAPAK